MDDLFDQQTVPEYNTRAVETMTGVPADTFRAWERRHGLPSPARTPGNHRLYSERDIAIISWLKQMTEQGVSISRAASMARRRLESPSSMASSASVSFSSVAPSNGNGLHTLEQLLLASFFDFDSQRANQIIEEALAIYDIETVTLDVIQPALVELGRMWERGEACMAVEHFATSFCMRKLSGLFNASQPELGSPTIIMSGVAGEMHELGLLAVALVFSRCGCRVIYLGANLPGSELVEAVRNVGPDAVVLSAPTPTSVETLRETIACVREIESSGTRPLIGYGGGVFEDQPELRDSVDALYLGKDARRAREQLEQALHHQYQEMAYSRT